MNREHVGGLLIVSMIMFSMGLLFGKFVVPPRDGVCASSLQSFVTVPGVPEERYWDGVRQGHCDRDCQYTHDGGLETNVSGVVRADDECVCQRWLGEPDWDWR